MARVARTRRETLKRCIAVLSMAAVLEALLPLVVLAAHLAHDRHRWSGLRPQPARAIPYPQLPLPLQIGGSQYIPIDWDEIPGWNDDDQLAALQAFRASCRSIVAGSGVSAETKALGSSLRDPCHAARAGDITDGAAARAFFERQFTPLRISRLGEDDGFVTGYYEPVLEGSRTQGEGYDVPLYRRPSNLFVRGYSQASPELPNKGPVYRKIGRRKLVPYYDRGEIEDGAIAGRGLEICWLKDPTDLLFAQIQGSARIHLADGSTIRINYDSYNGYPYTAVGRVLIERGIVPREEMSMQRIRDWMAQNPDGARELRRQNRAYVFFHEVALSDHDEAVGAQGISLTPGRSIAVDNSLHVYGTPFFITGELPIESAQSKTPFHRLMIAQDTGSAITGPARADLYFGAGAEAGRVSGRLRHAMHFVMLVPRSLDPVQAGRKLPLPDPRPSEKIARLFPQTDPAKEQLADHGTAAAAPKPPETIGLGGPTAVVTAVPLPEPRPASAPTFEERHHRYARRDRRIP